MFGIEKVVINQSAWHFRWLKWLHFISEREDYRHVPVYDQKSGNWLRDSWTTVRVVNAPKSICPYFWMLMGSLVLVGSAIALVLGAIGLAGWGIYTLIVWAIANPRTFLDVLEGLGLGLGFFAVVIAIFSGGWRLADWLRSRPTVYKAPKPKSTGLFYVVKTYAKAKKNKVCPLIEFAD